MKIELVAKLLQTNLHDEVTAASVIVAMRTTVYSILVTSGSRSLTLHSVSALRPLPSVPEPLVSKYYNYNARHWRSTWLMAVGRLLRVSPT
jgi:hypothetical protein